MARMGLPELKLGKEVAGDVEALSGLDAAAFEQVATIAAEQLRTGAPGGKAIKSAAAALGLGAAELATALEALSFVIAEAAHQNIPESGLREQLQEQLPLPAEAIEVLVQVSLAAAPQARSVAEDLGHPLPAFRSLDWRLDVQVAPALRLLPLPALTRTLVPPSGMLALHASRTSPARPAPHAPFSSSADGESVSARADHTEDDDQTGNCQGRRRDNALFGGGARRRRAHVPRNQERVARGAFQPLA